MVPQAMASPKGGLNTFCIGVTVYAPGSIAILARPRQSERSAT
jgi:hypothetical protein